MSPWEILGTLVGWLLVIAVLVVAGCTLFILALGLAYASSKPLARKVVKR